MDIIRSNTKRLDGLAQLQALLESGDQPAIGRTLGFSLIELEKGRAVFQGKPGRKVYNPMGSVHGGYAATLLDSACGCAVHTMLTASQSHTTLELDVSYHRKLTAKSGPIRAEGHVVSIGRRAAFAEAKLTDSSGTLYASASSTLMIFEVGS